MPACYDENNLPVFFPTELDAQREIADAQVTRIQQFLDGDREFDDAISTEEFVLPIEQYPDGSIVTSDGSVFGRLE